MKCRQVRELMGAYLYGDLSPTEMRDIRLHTQECFECREDLRERGQIIASLGDQAPVISESERQNIAWSVKGAIRQQQQEREYSRIRLSPAYITVVVLAVGLVLGSTISARMRSPKSEVPQQVATKADRDKERPREKARVEITEQRIAQEQPEDDSSRLTNEMIEAMSKVVIPAVNPGPPSRSMHAPERDNKVNKDDPAPVIQPDEVKQVDEPSDTTQLPKPQDINDAQTTDNTNDQ